MDDVISQESSHAASAVLDGDALIGGLVGGRLLWVEAVVVFCRDSRIELSQTDPSWIHKRRTGQC